MPYPATTLYPSASTFPGIHSVIPEPPDPELPGPPPSILSDVLVQVNGVSLSGRATDVSLESVAAELDTTPLGSEYRVYEHGIKETRLTTTVLQDPGTTEEMLDALYLSGESFEVSLRPTSAAITAFNPAWTSDAILIDYKRIGGNVGEAAAIDLAFLCDGPLVRSTV